MFLEILGYICLMWLFGFIPYHTSLLFKSVIHRMDYIPNIYDFISGAVILFLVTVGTPPLVGMQSVKLYFGF